MSELKTVIETWKNDYVYLLQSSITIPVNDITDSLQMKLFGGDRVSVVVWLTHLKAFILHYKHSVNVTKRNIDKFDPPRNVASFLSDQNRLTWQPTMTASWLRYEIQMVIEWWSHKLLQFYRKFVSAFELIETWIFRILYLQIKLCSQTTLLVISMHCFFVEDGYKINYMASVTRMYVFHLSIDHDCSVRSLALYFNYSVDKIILSVF